MADEVARRREIRRQRILQNAEERKKKIFGTGTTTSSNLDAPEETAKPDTVNNVESSQVHSSPTFTRDEEESIRNIPHVNAELPPQIPEIEKQQFPPIFNGRETDGGDMVEPKPLPAFRAENGIESIPELAEHIRNFNNLLTGGVSSTGSGPTQSMRINNDVQSAPEAVGALSTPAVPVILALFVCVLLSVNLGYVVSYSIALPFLLWEIHHLWCQRYVIEATSRGMGGLLGLALVLSGVQQSLISKMSRILTVFKCVFEDFAFYILMVVTWYCLIGLPGTLHVENEFPSEPEPVSMNAMEEEDAFGRMDEF